MPGHVEVLDDSDRETYYRESHPTCEGCGRGLCHRQVLCGCGPDPVEIEGLVFCSRICAGLLAVRS